MSIISKLLNHNQNSTVQPIKVGNEYMFEDQDILKEMEKYHVEKVIHNDAHSKVLQEKIKIWKDEARATTSKTIMDKEISKQEVKSTFGTCSGTPGPDGIFSKLIDNASREEMIECLQMLWGKSWKNGVFIKEWKKEHRAVLPKPDKETYHECSSYRTVSLTSILGKRFEKITSLRLTTYLDSIDIDVNQHAYMKARSSTHALY